MKDIQPLQLSDVHFWTFDVEKHLKNLEVFRAVLTKGEVVQSQKFKFDADRERYILAHGFKRYVLAHYLDIDPVEIVFFTGPQGKPYIKDSDIQFNLSHSSNRVVLGISKNTEIGVDVECTKKKTDFLPIAKRFFNENEYKNLNTLKESELAKGFYKAWTGKEAYIKALGEGLVLSLNTFEVDVMPEEPAKLLFSEKGNAEDWEMRTIHLSDDYIAAIATQQNVNHWLLYDYE